VVPLAIYTILCIDLVVQNKLEVEKIVSPSQQTEGQQSAAQQFNTSTLRQFNS